MPPGQWEARQAKNRRLDRAREEQMRGQRQEQAIGLNAKWEHQTDRRIRASAAEQRVAAVTKRESRDLLRRRRALAAQLKAEHASLSHELVNSFETMDERREKMVLRAKELQRMRENERQAEVKRLRDMQWRQSVDEIRTYRTKVVTLGLASDRLKQLEEKQEKDKKAAALEVEYARQWKQLERVKYERELEESSEVSKRNAATRASLAAQLVERNMILAEEKADDDRDNAMMMRLWDSQNQAEEDKITKGREDAALREIAVAKFNDHKKGLDDRKFDAEHALDRSLLAGALAREAAKKKQEQDKFNGLKKEMKNYQAFLKEQMIKEKVDTSYMEELMKAERDKEWNKREKRWDAEAEARRQLMIEVDKSRKIQIQSKVVRKQEDVVYDEVMARRVSKEAAKYGDAADRKVERQRLARLANRDAVMAQMAVKTTQKLESKLKESSFEDMDAAAEAEYAERLDKLYKEDHSGMMDFKRKAVQWYY